MHIIPRLAAGGGGSPPATAWPSLSIAYPARRWGATSMGIMEAETKAAI
jgi:hypothetical protein